MSKQYELDFLTGLKVNHQDYANEIGTLNTIFQGMSYLATEIKQTEQVVNQSLGDQVKISTFGATSGTAEEKKMLNIVACHFHWFGISLCNYVRLVGFINGLAAGEFSRADLQIPAKHKTIKASVDKYVKGVSEIESVKVWRNKVFAHFALTDPYKDDNIATLDMSVIFPVTLETRPTNDHRYVVGGMQLTKSDSLGTHQSNLPDWSLTEIFESLIPRYWPNVKWGKVPNQEQPKDLS